MYLGPIKQQGEGEGGDDDYCVGYVYDNFIATAVYILWLYNYSPSCGVGGQAIELQRWFQEAQQ